MRLLRSVVAAGLVLGLCGCHSAYIEATVSNRTGGPLALVEVDYPSASFGTEGIAAGADYHYRFKVLGSGATKVLWTDQAHVEHSLAGPELKENDEGRLTITFGTAGPSWDKSLTNRGLPR